MGVLSLNEDWTVCVSEKYAIHIVICPCGPLYGQIFKDNNMKIEMMRALGGMSLERMCVKYPNKAIKEAIKCCIADEYGGYIRIGVECIPSLDSNYPEKINIAIFISCVKIAAFELVKK